MSTCTHEDISTVGALEALPVGAVIETASGFIGWIKQADGSFANYQNWPDAPISAAEVLHFATILRRGVRSFEQATPEVLPAGTPVFINGRGNLYAVVRPANSRGMVQVAPIAHDRFNVVRSLFRPADKLLVAEKTEQACLCGTAPHFPTPDCK